MQHLKYMLAKIAKKTTRAAKKIHFFQLISTWKKKASRMQFLTLEILVKCPSGLLVLPHISVDALMGDHAFDPPLLALFDNLFGREPLRKARVHNPLDFRRELDTFGFLVHSFLIHLLCFLRVVILRQRIAVPLQLPGNHRPVFPDFLSNVTLAVPLPVQCINHVSLFGC